MTTWHLPERRRSPRIELPEEHCVLQIRTRVRLVDISASGALFGTDVPLPVGSAGHLRFALGGHSFAPAVRVRRRVGNPGRDLRLGSVFTSMDEKSRARLEEFLKSAMP